MSFKIPSRIKQAAPVLVIAAACLLGAALLYTGPETEPEPKINAAKIVQAVEIQPQTAPIWVSAGGTVIPARQVTIKPEVRGRVIRHHAAMVPGGILEEGEELVKIDPSDYELALMEQQTAYEEARFELEVERGRQVVASREWRLLQDDLSESEANSSLVLREPHLRRTEAMLLKATNEIAKARLALSRTSIQAPFNAVVLDEAVEIGQLVEPGNNIATLVGADEFWVQVSVTLSDLNRIELPKHNRPGADARIRWELGDGESSERNGEVFRLLYNLESEGLMARLLVNVEDPLNLRRERDVMPLLLGSYVNLKIEAGQLKDVLVIERKALRDGNKIWVVDGDNKLQIRDVHVLWMEGETSYISNVIQPGERLVVSNLRSALPGMDVKPQTEPDEQ